MFTHDDFLDVLRRHLAPRKGKAADKIPPIKGRTFLTEREIKKALTHGGQHLTIPRDAIVSPLAQDWLALKGVRIIRSS